MNEPAKPLRIFLSYAHTDVTAVRKLHRYLREKGFDVWFDKETLLPGQDWQLEIEKGLNNSDVVIICLSHAAVSTEGFVQREFKFALERTLDMPDGRIFLIPVRLQVCEVPTRLSRYHWVDLFEREGYGRLLRSLKLRAEQLARAHVDESQPANIPDSDASFGASLSIGRDVAGNIIMGDNNVINVMPALVAPDETAKREKAEAEAKIKEQERIAAEEAENERLAKIKAENERLAQEKIQQERITLQKIADAPKLAPIKAQQNHIPHQQSYLEKLARQKSENERAIQEKKEKDRLARSKTQKRLITLILGIFVLFTGCLGAFWFIANTLPTLPPFATQLMTQQASNTPTVTVTFGQQELLSFGGKGTGPGLFTDPRSIAIDPQSGHIYVADYQGGRVQAFDPLGKFITQWQVGDKKTIIRGMAADHQGNVFVVATSAIYRYNSENGKELGQIKANETVTYHYDDITAAADGTLYAIGGGETIVHMDINGNILSTIPKAISTVINEPVIDARITVDGEGNVYLLATYNNAVFKFGPKGKYINKFGSVGDNAGQFRAPYSIAVDSKGNIYVSDSKGIQAFDKDGQYIDVIDIQGASFGMTFDDQNKLYITTNTNKVIKFNISK